MSMDRWCSRRCVLRLLVILLFVSGVWNSLFNFEGEGLLDYKAVRKDEINQRARYDTSSDDEDIRHRLVHVISPYVVEDADEALFYPLDLNQWATMESIRRALRYVPSDFMKVEVVCPISKSDLEALSKAGLPCHRFVLLERSTRTEYPHLRPKRDLPFISDLIEAAMTSSLATTTTRSASFHVMLTNADIGLSKHLYRNLQSLFERFDSFSMNRLTIPEGKLSVKNDDVTNATDLLENQIDVLMQGGRKHPGYDMFCMSSSVLKRVRFGDFFLGRPPWGFNVHLMLEIMSDKYTNVKSNIHGTFHLGNNVSQWNRPTRSVQGIDDPGLVQIRKFCPAKSESISDDLSLKNEVNCGRWFLGNNRTIPFPSEHQQNVSIIYVPDFVRPGYENLYLQRYSKYLSYSESGLPLRLEALKGPGKNTKAKGVLSGILKAREGRKQHPAERRNRGQRPQRSVHSPKPEIRTDEEIQ